MKRKGQEEIVGFVAIVVLVAVIGLVLLGLALRQKPSESSSTEVYQLLESMMEVTSDCSLDFNGNARVRDLFEPCSKNNVCNDGQDTCMVLNESIESSLRNAFYKGNQTNLRYMFEVRLISNSSFGEVIISRNVGNCTGRDISGALYPLPAEYGRIDVSLKTC